MLLTDLLIRSLAWLSQANFSTFLFVAESLCRDRSRARILQLQLVIISDYMMIIGAGVPILQLFA